MSTTPEHMAMVMRLWCASAAHTSIERRFFSARASVPDPAVVATVFLEQVCVTLFQDGDPAHIQALVQALISLQDQGVFSPTSILLCLASHWDASAVHGLVGACSLVKRYYRAAHPSARTTVLGACISRLSQLPSSFRAKDQGVQACIDVLEYGVRVSGITVLDWSTSPRTWSLEGFLPRIQHRLGLLSSTGTSYIREYKCDNYTLGGITVLRAATTPTTADMRQAGLWEALLDERSPFMLLDKGAWATTPSKALRKSILYGIAGLTLRLLREPTHEPQLYSKVRNIEPGITYRFFWNNWCVLADQVYYFVERGIVDILALITLLHSRTKGQDYKGMDTPLLWMICQALSLHTVREQLQLRYRKNDRDFVSQLLGLKSSSTPVADSGVLTRLWESSETILLTLLPPQCLSQIYPQYPTLSARLVSVLDVLRHADLSSLSAQDMTSIGILSTTHPTEILGLLYEYTIVPHSTPLSVAVLVLLSVQVKTRLANRLLVYSAQSHTPTATVSETLARILYICRFSTSSILLTMTTNLASSSVQHWILEMCCFRLYPHISYMLSTGETGALFSTLLSYFSTCPNAHVFAISSCLLLKMLLDTNFVHLFSKCPPLRGIDLGMVFNRVFLLGFAQSVTMSRVVFPRAFLDSVVQWYIDTKGPPFSSTQVYSFPESMRAALQFSAAPCTLSWRAAMLESKERIHLRLQANTSVDPHTITQYFTANTRCQKLFLGAMAHVYITTVGIFQSTSYAKVLSQLSPKVKLDATMVLAQVLLEALQAGSLDQYCRGQGMGRLFGDAMDVVASTLCAFIQEYRFIDLHSVVLILADLEATQVLDRLLFSAKLLHLPAKIAYLQSHGISTPHQEIADYSSIHTEYHSQFPEHKDLPHWFMNEMALLVPSLQYLFGRLIETGKKPLLLCLITLFAPIFVGYHDTPVQCVNALLYLYHDLLDHETRLCLTRLYEEDEYSRYETTMFKNYRSGATDQEFATVEYIRQRLERTANLVPVNGEQPSISRSCAPVFGEMFSKAEVYLTFTTLELMVCPVPSKDMSRCILDFAMSSTTKTRYFIGILFHRLPVSYYTSAWEYICTDLLPNTLGRLHGGLCTPQTLHYYIHMEVAQGTTSSGIVGPPTRLKNLIQSMLYHTTSLLKQESLDHALAVVTILTPGQLLYVTSVFGPTLNTLAKIPECSIAVALEFLVTCILSLCSTLGITDTLEGHSETVYGLQPVVDFTIMLCTRISVYNKSGASIKPVVVRLLALPSPWDTQVEELLRVMN